MTRREAQRQEESRGEWRRGESRGGSGGGVIQRGGGDMARSPLPPVFCSLILDRLENREKS